jgi:hypothetical protein
VLLASKFPTPGHTRWSLPLRLKRRRNQLQKQNLLDNIYPCKDWVLNVQQRYAKNKTRVSDIMDTLLNYRGREIIKRELIRKMSPGSRYFKGYFSYEMSFLG